MQLRAVNLPRGHAGVCKQVIYWACTGSRGHASMHAYGHDSEHCCQGSIAAAAPSPVSPLFESSRELKLLSPDHNEGRAPAQQRPIVKRAYYGCIGCLDRLPHDSSQKAHTLTLERLYVDIVHTHTNGAQRFNTPSHCAEEDLGCMSQQMESEQGREPRQTSEHPI